MGRLVEMRDSLVYAIDRDGILNQIVRADAEEIDFAREDVGRESSAGNFDHRANFSGITECRSSATQLFFAFGQDGERAPQFTHTGNHWEHDFHVADGSGPKDSAQLGFEDVDVFKTKTDRAPAQERV